MRSWLVALVFPTHRAYVSVVANDEQTNGGGGLGAAAGRARGTYSAAPPLIWTILGRAADPWVTPSLDR